MNKTKTNFNLVKQKELKVNFEPEQTSRNKIIVITQSKYILFNLVDRSHLKSVEELKKIFDPNHLLFPVESKSKKDLLITNSQEKDKRNDNKLIKSPSKKIVLPKLNIKSQIVEENGLYNIVTIRKVKKSDREKNKQ